MVRMETYESREAWLEHRRLGGSDIGAAAGRSHWLTNVELWRLKTGRDKPKENLNNAFIEYGTKAEEHIRELFRLDYPEYKVFYEPNNLWTNDKLPFASASLDGWLKDSKDRMGVLEIKTAMISSSRASAQWKDRIPDSYFAQLLWNMIVTESDFGVLVAQLKHEIDGDMYKITRHYFAERQQVKADMEALIEAGTEFWRYVEEDREPPLKLPTI